MFCVYCLEVGLLFVCVEFCVGGVCIIGDIKDFYSCIVIMFY